MTILSILVGWIAPAKLTGRLLLRKEIGKLGLDNKIFSNKCIDELVENDISSAKFFKKRNQPWKSRFVYEIEGTALSLAVICDGELAHSYSNKPDPDTPNVVLEILAKHHPHTFPINRRT